MQIILEGPDGIGKSTLCEYLKDNYKLDYIHNLADNPNTLEYYLNQLNQYNNVVIDRGSISELVYSNVYNRNIRMPWDDQIKFLESFNGIYIICYASNYNDLKTRFMKRGDTDLVTENLREINGLYKFLARLLSEKFNNIFELDISKYNNKKSMINYFEKIKGF